MPAGESEFMKTMAKDPRASAVSGVPSQGIPDRRAVPIGHLERALGKPRATWTADDLVRFVQERGIRLVTLMHVGGDGWIKTLDFVPESPTHLADILSGGERADGSSLMSGLTRGASDIVLRPRLETAFIDPFSPFPTLALLSSHFNREGEPLAQSPDTIVHRAYERVLGELGVDLWALGEVEFFLGKRASDEDVYGVADSGYHASSPFVFGEALRREALVLLADMGVPIKYGHSEVGAIDTRPVDGMIWEQHEIELLLTPLPRAADSVMLTRWVLQNLARRQGFQCTFAPVVREGHAGNGLHFHFSPRVDGEHMGGMDETGSLAPSAQWLIGGLVQFGGALMAFGNREHTSFLRLTQGKEAPTSVTWGRYDRQALVRLPIVALGPDGQPVTPPTIEFRLADGSAHPHLLLAAIAQAMAQGRRTEGLAEILRETASGRGTAAGQGAVTGESAASTADESHAPRDEARSVAHRPAQVAAALRSHRDVFEAGGVFPPALLDTVLAQFEGR